MESINNKVEVINYDSWNEIATKIFWLYFKWYKRIEIRLNDEKRKRIKLGDKIKFLKETDLKESFEAQVIGLLKYNSFEELLRDYDISILSDANMTKDELISTLEQFYTKEKQKQYGVLGIRIELI